MRTIIVSDLERGGAGDQRLRRRHGARLCRRRPGPASGRRSTSWKGPGVAILDPWLAETREGVAIVTLGFSDAAEGEVSEDVAHRANIWFRRYADSDRDMRITDEEIRDRAGRRRRAATRANASG